MPLFEVDGIAYPLECLELELPAFDLIRWISKQTLYPKVFWKEKGTTTTRAAIGNLLSFPRVPKFEKTPIKDIRLYGGIRFAKKTLNNDKTWRGFPQTCFWLPQVEISQIYGKTTAVIYFLNEKPTVSSDQFFDFDDSPLNDIYPCLLDRKDSPELAIWQKNVNHVLAEIEATRLSKLVLARKSLLRFSSPLSPWPLIEHLKATTNQATVFAYQLAPNTSFLGATPEKFFQREDTQFKADAIAGTRARGGTPDEDRFLEQELLSDAKENREFEFVSQFLHASLEPFADELRWQWPRTNVLKGSHVQHLYNHLSVKLKPDISDSNLIQALHPTPALGGFPRENVLSYLNALEPFDRGWYGAPVGFIGPHKTSLYVGIRSGLIRDRSLHLFAGTGLVKGSVAEREWNELEQKIRPFTELFINN